MSEFFSVNSTTASDETDPMRLELDRVKAKAAQEHAKIKALKKQVSDLTLKNQLLEEENKLLQATRVVPPQKPQETVKMIPQTKVTEVLLGFDQLIEQNSKEINKLMNDRDRLSSVCFNSISLISSQEIIIKKFKSATQKLLRFVNHYGETYESIVRDFRSLGIDVSSDLNSINRTYQVNTIINNVSLDNKKKVDSSEIQQILQLLPKTNMNDASLKTVTQYLYQQIDAEKEYKNTIEELSNQKKQVEVDYNTLLAKLCTNQTKKVNLKHAMEQIDIYNQRSKQASNLENLVSNLVDTFASFGDRFDNDPDIQRCLSRIRFWLQGSPAEINIVQEIDFLLGMCLTEKKVQKVSNTHAYNDDSSCSFKDHRYKKCCYERNMIRQVKELKESVIDMKDRLEDVNRRKCRRY
ncbi:hypothetical protein TVAG_283390 [Trichomonas vaginalis G3]|uniref:Uncharacterized protein n=1 Tax=Trichomonas vaginalis (strain ATCC PRA-98 / G3) TaxID=412133 RepID=A2DEP3_TRIV3|nr:hypothetical protein TVAGG3_0577260 [Trichomonas vaginalis G3]EAY21170.1 hypothetical protein TVAG_283390 [Trichomonas vaginalis G3]KAI5522301.1 hypothetical protein TVAGG3_0577260 [Trichomonas vaginalis G3]|eukprot:XP_001582156.1 hypothetical protein [Trichomonas vaginalis G3]